MRSNLGRLPSQGQQAQAAALRPLPGTTPLAAGLGRAAWLVAAALLLGTIAFVATPSLRFAIYAPQLDIALTTIGAIVAIAVAALGLGRYREQGGGDVLLEASAFLVLAVANVVNGLVIIAGIDGSFGLRIDDPGQLPLYFWAFVRLSAAALLAAASVPWLARRYDGTSRPGMIVVLPTALVAAACAAVWLVHDGIPDLIDPGTLRRLADETLSAAPLPGINLGILLLDGVAGILLMVAALGFSRTSERPTGLPSNYLVVGLIIAAFSQLHFILYPAVYSGLVSTGDWLRIAFYVVLIAGISKGARADLQALHAANARLRLLAAAEADRTAIAERARLARELHDGLAQNLWRTKLEFDRLVAQLNDADSMTATQLQRVREALDAARREASDAVGALRSGFDAGLSLSDEIPRRLDAFVDRTGFRVDLDLDAAAARLPGVFAAEVLRILDESLNNVEKHADATRIRVSLALIDGTLLVTVDDNGQGFSPAAASHGLGLLGMRERAGLLGGSLDVRSAPGDGTTVTLRVPHAVPG